MAAETTTLAIELFVGLVAAAGLVGWIIHRLRAPDPVHRRAGRARRRRRTSCSRSTSRSAPRSSCSCCCRASCSRPRSGSTSTISGGRSAGSSCSPRRACSSARRSWPRFSHVATGLPLELGFVVGAMVAATDPVAVVSTFKQLGSPRRLATLIESESLFNDGTALVVFTIAVQAVVGSVTPGEHRRLGRHDHRRQHRNRARQRLGRVAADRRGRRPPRRADAVGRGGVRDLHRRRPARPVRDHRHGRRGAAHREPRPAGRHERAVARGARHRLGVRRRSC